MSLDFYKHYEWQQHVHFNPNHPEDKNPEYHYIFTPVATLSIGDYRNSTDKIKGSPYYKPWRVFVDTNETMGYDETVRHYLEVKGTTLEEVKKESLEFFRKYAYGEMNKLVDVLSKLEIMV